MGRSRRPAALLALAAAFSTPRAADLCEGCWEIGGRGGFIAPSREAGAEPAAGPGAVAGFRFRPFWSVEFSYDRFAATIQDGPDETLTFFLASLVYTFRAAREQRTRPYAFLAGGIAHDAVGSHASTVSTPAGPVLVRSRPETDTVVATGLGAGGNTTLGRRAWLRYELRRVEWSTFGVGQSSLCFFASLGVSLGR